MLVCWLAHAASVSWAHQPHDTVDFLDVSPGFADDGVVVLSRFPNQNWRTLEVSVSTDGAVNWSSSLRGLQYHGSLSDLRLSPDFPSDGVGMVSTRGDGAWLTEDGAASWRQVLDGDKVLLGGVVGRGAGTPFLLVAEDGMGLLRSADLGVTWTAAGGPSSAEALAALGEDVAVTGDGSVFVSSDGGVTFVETALGVATFDVAVAGGAVAVATEEGVLFSQDGSAFRLLEAFGAGIRVVGLSPGFPSDPTIYAAQQRDGIFVSEDGGETSAQFDIGVGLSDQVADHFNAIRFSGTYPVDGTVFLAMYEGLLLSRDHGRTWSQSDTRPPGVINALETSPQYPTDGVVLVASYDAGMWLSADGGDTWEIRNSDLNLSAIYDVDFATDSLGNTLSLLGQNGQVVWGEGPSFQWREDSLPPEAEYSSRVAFSPGFAEDGVALVGTREGGMFRTADAGETWVGVTGPLDAVSAISWLGDGSAVLIGTKNGEVLRSTDGGRSFSAIADFTKNGEAVWIDAGPAGFLVGTASGLFTSQDGTLYSLVPEVGGIVHQVIVAADGTRFAGIRGGGLFRSEAEGPFVQVGLSLTDLGSPYEYATSPAFATDGTIFAAIGAALHRSRDRGETWEQVGMAVVRYEEDCQVLVPRLADVLTPEASSRRVAVVGPGATVDMQFTGHGFAFLGVTREDLGDAEVSIDGAVVGSFTQFGAEAYQVEQFRIDSLANGVHLLRVRASGVLPIELDAIDVFVPLGDASVDPADTGTPLSDTGSPPQERPADVPPERCGCASNPAGPGWSAVSFALMGLWGVRRLRPRANAAGPLEGI